MPMLRPPAEPAALEGICTMRLSPRVERTVATLSGQEGLSESVEEGCRAMLRRGEAPFAAPEAEAQVRYTPASAAAARRWIPI